MPCVDQETKPVRPALPSRLHRTLHAAIVSLLLLAPPAHASVDAIDTLTVPELLSRAESLPPAALYLLASKLFGEGRRPEAARWLYVAQIRARYQLATSPELPPDAEPALYAALGESVGRPINEWAFGDVPAVAASMKEALEWDAAHPNAVTPKGRDPATLERIRGGLAQMRLEVLSDADEIRRQRRANGLGNR